MRNLGKGHGGDAWSWIGLTVPTLVSASLAAICYASRVREQTLRRDLTRVQELLEKERGMRQAERAGRIKAERTLRARDANSSSQPPFAPAAAKPDGPVPVVWRDGGSGAEQCKSGSSEGPRAAKRGSASSPGPPPMAFTPIGVARSCFSQRNGTPRQPLLVPGARARIELAPWVPPLALDGLDGYSHCWVLYIFHANTDGLGALDASLGPPKPGATFRAKVRVPRLDGKKMGVLATRSPHRPVPIGLSIAKVESVTGRIVVISGADIVDGSPVVDIKPYVPFCESIPDAVAPIWVQVEAPNEPLHISLVLFCDGAKDVLRKIWMEGSGHSRLSSSGDAFVELVFQVLSRDIRSIHKRTQFELGGDMSHCTSDHTDDTVQLQDKEDCPAADAAEVDHNTHELHVILEGVEVAYRMCKQRQVMVTGGRRVSEYKY